MERFSGINIPPVRDVEMAVRLYYGKSEITTRDIMELFGIGRTKAQILKHKGLEEQEGRNVPLWDARSVNTKCAFDSWGIDIAYLEKTLRTIRRLRLNGNK